MYYHCRGSSAIKVNISIILNCPAIIYSHFPLLCFLYIFFWYTLHSPVNSHYIFVSSCWWFHIYNNNTNIRIIYVIYHIFNYYFNFSSRIKLSTNPDRDTKKKLREAFSRFYNRRGYAPNRNVNWSEDLRYVWNTWRTVI